MHISFKSIFVYIVHFRDKLDQKIGPNRQYTLLKVVVNIVFMSVHGLIRFVWFDC